MDLSSQHSNKELVNNAKIGVSRPRKSGRLVDFRVNSVKLSCREVHQKRFFHRNGGQGCSG